MSDCSPRGVCTASVVLAVTLAACSAPGDSGSDPTGTVSGVALSGPTCPVEPAPSEPTDETCDDQPVAGAKILIIDSEGKETTRLDTGLDGTFTGEFPAGEYRLVPQPMEGFVGTPEHVEVIVEAGEVTRIEPFVYDTGIR